VSAHGQAGPQAVAVAGVGDETAWEPSLEVESTAEVEALLERLWPILRSVTGQGVRETLEILSELVALRRIEVPSFTEVLDWTVPAEWVVREAYVLTPAGDRILDVRENNLHLLNYSVSFSGELTRAQLDEHLYSLPEQPEAIPYLTSYYEPRWGFCISHRQRERLADGLYRVVIDTEHIRGSMSIGEALLPGRERGEVLISTYTCHPSLANNELSGPVVAALLYRRLSRWRSRRLSYRFVFAPETIGAIAYLSLRGQHLRERLLAGYVVTCVGTDERFTLKRSRRGQTLADRAALHVLAGAKPPARVLSFFPTGSDERQYCSPGFDLPVASVMRSVYGEYPEYHTSLDDLKLIATKALIESVDVYERIMLALDANVRYLSSAPMGEPQLGRRGLYETLGARSSPRATEARLWVLNYADGDHDLLEVAELSGISLAELAIAGSECASAGLLSECPQSPAPWSPARQVSSRDSSSRQRATSGQHRPAPPAGHP
jgi:aminopeptidase-like protein